MNANDEVFSEQDFADAYPEGIEKHFWTRARNQLLAHTLKVHGCVNEPILEIGCGTGVVVGYLRNLGLDCWGSELGSPQEAKGAEGYIYCAQDCRSIDAEIRAKFCTIMLLDVIEHMEDPISFMASLRTSFPNMRKLIVTVPARKELWSNYDENYGHYRRYNRSMLKNELAGAGYRLVESRYFFHLLYIVMRMLRVTGRNRSTDIKAPKGKIIFIHFLLASVCKLENMLFPRRFVGTSLLAIAK